MLRPSWLLTPAIISIILIPSGEGHNVVAALHMDSTPPAETRHHTTHRSHS
jgi:hypothetical protein